MKILPKENLVFRTSLSEMEVLGRLKETVETEKRFRIRISGFSSGKSYAGKIDKERFIFAISRLISYNNSFLPRIEGLIEKDVQGTVIRVKMHLHIFARVFMYIWLGLVSVVCLVILPFFFIKKEFEPMLLIPFAMLLFGVVLPRLAFALESKKSVKDFEELFAAKAEQED